MGCLHVDTPGTGDALHPAPQVGHIIDRIVPERYAQADPYDSKSIHRRNRAGAGTVPFG